MMRNIILIVILILTVTGCRARQPGTSTAGIAAVAKMCGKNVSEFLNLATENELLIYSDMLLRRDTGCFAREYSIKKEYKDMIVIMKSRPQNRKKMNSQEDE